jgi:hypothetical protein
VYEKVDPTLDDLRCLKFHELMKILQFLALQRPLSRGVGNFDPDHAPGLHDDLRPALASVTFSMDVNRFMFVRVKEDQDAKVFVELRHGLDATYKRRTVAQAWSWCNTSRVTGGCRETTGCTQRGADPQKGRTLVWSQQVPIARMSLGGEVANGEHAGAHRIQMNVVADVSKRITGFDEQGLVAALKR